MNRFVDRCTLHGNVVVNFLGAPIDDLPAFAKGYHEAARLVGQHLATSAGYADYEGYPIVFLYRHALELYLKAVVYRGAAVLGLLDQHVDTSIVFRSHKLSPLLKPLHAIVTRMKWQFEGTSVGSLVDLERLFRDVEDLDPDSYAFRYPVTKNRTPLVSHHYTVDVVFLAQQLDPVLDLLEGACIHLHEEYQAVAQAKYELQEYLATDADPQQ